MSKAARNPLFAVGLRRHLGEQCMDVLPEQNKVFHMYHERLKENKHHGAITSDLQDFTSIMHREKRFEILHLFGYFQNCAARKIQIYMITRSFLTPRQDRSTDSTVSGHA